MFRSLVKISALFSVLLIVSCPVYAAPLIWNVPNKNSHFVGREEILKQIHNSFSSSQNLVVIAGSSGFGKSQVTKEYAHKHYEHYDVVWWFKANGFLENQVKSFVLELSIVLNLNLEEKLSRVSHEQRIRFMKEIIRKHGLKCLIVFDDAKMFTDVKHYIPSSTKDRADILVTTKNMNFSDQHIAIPSFTKHESRQYIKQFLPHEREEIIEGLSDIMSDCPAAIAMTIEHVKADPNLSLKTHLGILQQEKKELAKLLQRKAEKFDGALEGYEKDLFATVNLSLQEVKKRSPQAYKFLCYLTVFQHQQIERRYLKKWASGFGTNVPVSNLINSLRSRSFVDYYQTAKKNVVDVSMHELIQKIVRELISPEERETAFEEAAETLLLELSGRSDLVVEKVVSDETPLLHAISVVDIAHDNEYRSPAVLKLRVRVFDLLVGIIRDFDKAKAIESQIQEDLTAGFEMDDYDAAQYHIDMSVYTANINPDFDIALEHVKKATEFLAKSEIIPEEEIRLLANKLQLNTHRGEFDEGREAIVAGDQLLSISQSPGYNALYIFAKAAFLNESADFQGTIDVVESGREVFEAAKLYPSSGFWALYQKAYAQTKVGDIDGAAHSIEVAEQQAKSFRDTPDRIIFANLNVAKGLCAIKSSEHYPEAISSLNDAVSIYKKIYKTDTGHKRQALAFMVRAQLHMKSEDWDAARSDFKSAENVIAVIMQDRPSYLVAELFKCWVKFGINIADDGLIRTYLKKLIDTFGLDHEETKTAILFLDQRGIDLPL